MSKLGYENARIAALVILLVGIASGCIGEKDVEMEITGEGDRLSQEAEVETWCAVTNHGGAGTATIKAFVVFEGTYGETTDEDTRTVTLAKKEGITLYFYFDMPDGTSTYTIGFEIVSQTKD